MNAFKQKKKIWESKNTPVILETGNLKERELDEQKNLILRKNQEDLQ
jgi:hypothetical protein